MSGVNGLSVGVVIIFILPSKSFSLMMSNKILRKQPRPQYSVKEVTQNVAQVNFSWCGVEREVPAEMKQFYLQKVCFQCFPEFGLTQYLWLILQWPDALTVTRDCVSVFPKNDVSGIWTLYNGDHVACSPL